MAPVPSHDEVVQSLSPEVERQLRMLAPPRQVWQPADYLPDFAVEGWQATLGSLRAEAFRLPDDLLAVLVGDTVTEEALPSYAMALNQLVRDTRGTSPGAWPRWLRGWTAEENRHGDLLNGYLRLSGRVDMRAVEVTIHDLIAGGFDSGSQDDPYNLLVYTSFQERATRISHRNVAALAERAGAPLLARICRVIAGEEARHETFYQRMMACVFDVDPAGAMLAFSGMLDRQIAMPGSRMGGDVEPDLFERFARAAQRTGVYTGGDYAAIVDHLLRTWQVTTRSVSGEAARVQERLGRAAERYARLAARAAASVARQPAPVFNWIAPRARASALVVA
ncbi:MAG: acyl-ACP desaturase [Vicinamibacterales bacterium]